MEKLIEALQIFLKYGNPIYPTYCSHDTLHITDAHKDKISKDDIKRLDELGFFWSTEDDCFISFFFGSA